MKNVNKNAKELDNNIKKILPFKMSGCFGGQKKYVVVYLLLTLHLKALEGDEWRSNEQQGNRNTHGISPDSQREPPQNHSWINKPEVERGEGGREWSDG